jgi:hypothetical protein
MTELFGRVSIARFIFVCAAVCGTVQRAAAEAAPPSRELAPYSAWQGSTPYASPPAIVLRATPPPELAPLEYARRPFELAPEFALGFPNCSDGSANDTRCQGLGAGVGLGLSALWRVTPYFAFGGTLSASRFAFSPKGSSELRDSSASGVFYGLLGRVYFADHGPVEPYLELALGGGADRTSAREGDDVKYSETALGGAVRVGGAVEFYLGRHLRLGPALDWTRFRVSHVERCDATQTCVDLDPGQNGHGVGFTTLSARLTILLGPGL